MRFQWPVQFGDDSGDDTFEDQARLLHRLLVLERLKTRVLEMEPLPGVKLTKLDALDIRTVLPEEFRQTRLSNFIACSKRDFNRFLLVYRTLPMPWVQESQDCDWHAMRFVVYARAILGITTVGVVIDNSSTPIPHAFNIVGFDDGAIWLYEPNRPRRVKGAGTSLRVGAVTVTYNLQHGEVWL